MITFLDKPLNISIDEQNGILNMTFHGDISHEKNGAFKAELEIGKNLIADYHAAHTRKVKVLLNMTDFSGTYNLNALNALVGFARENTPYVDRTASFGGSDKVKMAGEIAIALADRDNIKVCDTKEEAERWILG